MSENDTSKVLDAILRHLLRIFIVLAATVFAVNFLIINAFIPTISMEPTIMAGDIVLGNRLAYAIKGPERYDIVIFRPPDHESDYFIKRVVGLPGDKIDIHDGKVYINGEESTLDMPYTDTGNMTFPVTVPKGEYLMLGDNRMNSSDSRYWHNHFVRKDELVGKAIFRYWKIPGILK